MKTLIITLIAILSPVFLHAEDGVATAGKKGAAMMENSEADLEAKAAKNEKAMKKAADKEAAKAAKAVEAAESDAVDDAEKEAAAKLKKADKAGKPVTEGDMPKGLAKQAEKKGEQVQKDADKAAPEAQEKRKKWWKFW